MNAQRRVHNWILIAAAACFFFALPAHATEKIRVATLYIGSSMLPLWIAKEEGDFSRRGLEVELIWLQSTLSTYALIAGEVDLIFGTPQETLLAMTGKAPPALVTVGSWETNSKHWLVVSSAIQSPKDLVGKNLATSRPKAADEGYARIILETHGTGHSAFKEIHENTKSQGARYRLSGRRHRPVSLYDEGTAQLLTGYSGGEHEGETENHVRTVCRSQSIARSPLTAGKEINERGGLKPCNRK